MKLRNRRPNGKRWHKVNLRRKIRRVENNTYEVKRDSMIGRAGRRGWGAGLAKI